MGLRFYDFMCLFILMNKVDQHITNLRSFAAMVMAGFVVALAASAAG